MSSGGVCELILRLEKLRQTHLHSNLRSRLDVFVRASVSTPNLPILMRGLMFSLIVPPIVNKYCYPLDMLAGSPTPFEISFELPLSAFLNVVSCHRARISARTKLFKSQRTLLG